jgi:hypothetical protein
MNNSWTFLLLLILQLSLITLISFGFGTLIKEKTRLKLYFYLPFGFIAALAVTYILCYPFVFFLWDSRIYFGLLAFIYALVVGYGIKTAVIQKYFRTINKEKILLGLLCLVFLGITAWQIQRNTMAENAFDSVFYLKDVINNATSTVLEWKSPNYEDLNSSFHMFYDLSSYYYFYSFLLWLIRIIPGINEVMFAPLYSWAAALSLTALSYTIAIDALKAVFREKSKIAMGFIICLFSVFFGSFYYNTALGFFGNSFRIYLSGAVILIMWLLSKMDQPERYDWLVLSACFAALIASSSSGFFISAFLIYGWMFAYMKDKGTKAFAIMAFTGIPVYLFLFAYFLLYHTFWLTPLFVGALYGISKIKGRKFYDVLYWLMCAVPVLLALFVFIRRDQLSYGYSYFFYQGSNIDMVWDYFVFSSEIRIIINIIFIGLFLLLFLKLKDPIIQMILVVFVTFLNPLVIPFTIQYLTRFVFYRAFDIFVNPFVLVLEFSILSEWKYLQGKWKQWLCVVLVVPFLLFGVNNYQKHYHIYFNPQGEYNWLLRQTVPSFEVLTALNKEIKEQGLTYPVVASQIYATMGYVPNIEVPWSHTAMMEGSEKFLDKTQLMLLNVMLPRQNPNEYWINGVQPPGWILGNLLQELNVKFVIVDKDSVYINETGEIVRLYDEMDKTYEHIYENSEYRLYDLDKWKQD